MISLDADTIREAMPSAARDNVAQLKIFGEIDSTNDYLMQVPGPEPGKICIAVTNNQTAGRGRHGKTWQAPPGSGVCLSASYTFAPQPENLPALTLALGLGVVAALQELGAEGIEVKRPNDLVILNGKLGGILTEVQAQNAGTVTVVTGVGINVDVGEDFNVEIESDWADRVADLKSICQRLPSHDEVAAKLTTHMLQAFVDFEANGLATIVKQWSQYDWLLDRTLIVDSGQEIISGTGAGIDSDGALLINTLESGMRRVISGSVVKAAERVSSK